VNNVLDGISQKVRTATVTTAVRQRPLDSMKSKERSRSSSGNRKGRKNSGRSTRGKKKRKGKERKKEGGDDKKKSPRRNTKRTKPKSKKNEKSSAPSKTVGTESEIIDPESASDKPSSQSRDSRGSSSKPSSQSRDSRGSSSKTSSKTRDSEKLDSDDEDALERLLSPEAEDPRYEQLMKDTDDEADLSADQENEDEDEEDSVYDPEDEHIERPENENIDPTQTRPSGHRIIFLRHAVSINNHYSLKHAQTKVTKAKAGGATPRKTHWGRFLGGALSGVLRVYKANKRVCLKEPCLCLPYDLDEKKGHTLVNKSKCSKFTEEMNKMRDCLLTESGETEAIQVGKSVRRLLANTTVTKFLVSPLRRTIETMLAAFGPTVAGSIQVMPDLHEAVASLSDWAYSRKNTWGFVQAYKAKMESENRKFSNATFQALKDQLLSDEYRDELIASYPGWPKPDREKIIQKNKTGKKAKRFSEGFHERMRGLRKKLLAMPPGTYVIVSHGGIGSYFFPKKLLQNLAVVSAELNGNLKNDLVMHSFEAATSMLPDDNLPGWRKTERRITQRVVDVTPR